MTKPLIQQLAERAGVNLEAAPALWHPGFIATILFELCAYLDERAATQGPPLATDGIPLGDRSNGLVNALMATCGQGYTFNGERYYCKLPCGHGGPHTDEVPAAPEVAELGPREFAKALRAAPCRCIACVPMPMFGRMRVCSRCGNKRCPHTDDHRNVCFGSNDLGQKPISWDAHVTALTDELASRCDHHAAIHELNRELVEAREALAKAQRESSEFDDVLNATSDTSDKWEQLYLKTNAELAKVTAERDELNAQLAWEKAWDLHTKVAMSAVVEAARQFMTLQRYSAGISALQRLEDALRALDALTAAAAKPPEETA